MIRRAYHEEIKKVEQEVIKMGDMVIKAIKESIEALKNLDIKRAKAIALNDHFINKKRFDIEEECLLLIATQQPVAKDLRTLAAILSIITDLERMADHAEGIAKICIMNEDKPLVKALIDIPRMAEKSIDMLKNCLTAFINRDVETAKKICDEDDEVDSLYEQVYKELLVLMIENPKIIEGGTYLMWAAHNIERVADRTTNIAERVVFMVTGKMEEINVSNY